MCNINTLTLFAIYASCCKPDGKVYKMQSVKSARWIYKTDSFTEPNKCGNHILQELLTSLVGQDRKWFFWYCARLKLMRACTFCDSPVCTSVRAQFTRGCTLQHFVIVPCVSQSEHSYPNISVSQPRSIFHFWLYATSQPNQHKSHTMEMCYFVNLVLKSQMIPQIYSSILGHYQSSSGHPSR